MDKVGIRDYDKAIILYTTKAILVAYPSELVSLIQNDEDMLFKALKRGKSEKRYQACEKRKTI